MNGIKLKIYTKLIITSLIPSSDNLIIFLSAGATSVVFVSVSAFSVCSFLISSITGFRFRTIFLAFVLLSVDSFRFFSTSCESGLLDNSSISSSYLNITYCSVTFLKTYLVYIKLL